MERISSAANSSYNSVFRVPSRVLLLLIVFLAPVLLRSQTSSSAFLQGNIIAADGSGIPRAHGTMPMTSGGTILPFNRTSRRWTSLPSTGLIASRPRYPASMSGSPVV